MRLLNPKQISAFAVGMAMLAIPMMAKDKAPDTVQERVRHQLASLPYLTVFDDLQFRVDGGTVTLLGEVVWPTLKSDAQNVVKKVEGVTRVDNQIEVLPVSPLDRQIRFRELHAIYDYPALQHYGMGVLPDIHIIVKNGHVTLKGVVNSETDKNLANIRANGVPNVFSVTNDLQVAK